MALVQCIRKEIGDSVRVRQVKVFIWRDGVAIPVHTNIMLNDMIFRYPILHEI